MLSGSIRQQVYQATARLSLCPKNKTNGHDRCCLGQLACKYDQFSPPAGSTPLPRCLSRARREEEARDSLARCGSDIVATLESQPALPLLHD
jgi:hypothetical protein